MKTILIGILALALSFSVVQESYAGLFSTVVVAARAKKVAKVKVVKKIRVRR